MSEEECPLCPILGGEGEDISVEESTYEGSLAAMDKHLKYTECCESPEFRIIGILSLATRWIYKCKNCNKKLRFQIEPVNPNWFKEEIFNQITEFPEEKTYHKFNKGALRSLGFLKSGSANNPPKTLYKDCWGDWDAYVYYAETITNTGDPQYFTIYDSKGSKKIRVPFDYIYVDYEDVYRGLAKKPVLFVGFGGERFQLIVNHNSFCIAKGHKTTGEVHSMDFPLKENDQIHIRHFGDRFDILKFSPNELG